MVVCLLSELVLNINDATVVGGLKLGASANAKSRGNFGLSLSDWPAGARRVVNIERSRRLPPRNISPRITMAPRKHPPTARKAPVNPTKPKRTKSKATRVRKPAGRSSTSSRAPRRPRPSTDSAATAQSSSEPTDELEDDTLFALPADGTAGRRVGRSSRKSTGDGLSTAPPAPARLRARTLRVPEARVRGVAGGRAGGGRGHRARADGGGAARARGRRRRRWAGGAGEEEARGGRGRGGGAGRGEDAVGAAGQGAQDAVPAAGEGGVGSGGAGRKERGFCKQ